MGCWCNLELEPYPGPCWELEAVTHVGHALDGYQSVMLGVHEASTFQIMCRVFQSHPVDYLMLVGWGCIL
jgi:hypothetical protein